ncbi:uncharacterized protein B0P05DRAFT_556686 [Gilbertella persicaria]|uniref:uncharacterized protein n=1 Tax=Gilbertella persicaria TaxID=101096 RepID=UPI0022209A1E|nr:uncharacterized protein B0P05DRAFT_556686 [Gilbertella persicaria]KAI8062369.1 hypothetical protein B0P05DRAFT_556686 [Gilbertella persicaria]
MDLNFCLYCEKHLPEENMSFCSSICQAREASKPITSPDFYPSRLYMMGSRSTTTTNYESIYHRCLSFSNNSFHCQPLSSSSSSSSSSSISSNNSSYILDKIPYSCHISLSQHTRHPHSQSNQQNVYTNCFFI